MKALLCTHYGPPEEMELREMPSPAPGKNQVLIAVKACGVNFPDVLMLADKYQFKPPLPFPPGGEVAGVVKALGEGVTQSESRRPRGGVDRQRRLRGRSAGGCAALRADAGQCRLRRRVARSS